MFEQFHAFAQVAPGVAEPASGPVSPSMVGSVAPLLLLVVVAIGGFLVFRARKGSGGGAPTAGDDNIDV